MNRWGINRPLLIFVVLLICGSTQMLSATPESRAGALFLLISPSARVNGMGQAGVALADEPGGYYNPAAPALGPSGPVFSGRFYVSEMDWLPQLVNNLTYTRQAVQVGGELGATGVDADKRARLRGVLYGYRTRLDQGRQAQFDARGNRIGSFSNEERADHLGVSLGLRSIVDVGVGATFKWIRSELGELDANATAYDVGLMAQLPIVGVYERYGGRTLIWQEDLRPILELSYGLAWHNRGGKRLDYGRVNTDPLPTNRRHGWSVRFGVRWVSEAVAVDMLSLRWVSETYRPQVDGVASDASAEDDKRGFELSLLETIDVQRGKYDDVDGQVRLETVGLTVRSDALFALWAAHLRTRGQGAGEGGLLWTLERVSVRWSWFEYRNRTVKSPVAGVSHMELGIAF